MLGGGGHYNVKSTISCNHHQIRVHTCGRNKWQVVATFPPSQKKQIGGFKSEAEAVAWIGSPRCLAWIKVQGYE